MKIDISRFRRPCSCGKEHSILVEDMIIEAGAIRKLPQILQGPSFAERKNIVMICDENTYEAAGREVEKLVPGLRKVVMNPENLHANEHGVALCKEGLDQVGEVDLMLAVGSGTVHDITRYHAYNTGIPFISVPTAASVDGFVSTVAAMTWNGCKVSITAASPSVVVADTDIFKNAPLRLTASGVGDLLGKYTALADWKIAHILTDEYICDEIIDLEYQVLDSLTGCFDGLREGSVEAYESLMYGLLLSGIAMQMTGNSRPASGAEHHFSHLWEMAVINDEIDFYHGEKVGVGLILAAKIYHKTAEYLRSGDFTVAQNMPVEWDLIRKAFTKPEMLEQITKENTPNLLDKVDSQKILQKRNEIADVIDTIPQAEELVAMLAKIDGIRSLSDLGFDDSYQEKTARLSPYVRARLTWMRIMKYCSFYENALKA